MEQMRAGEGRFLSTGQMQEVPGSRQKHQLSTFHERVEYHLKAETHLWTVALLHYASEGLLKAFGGETPDSLPLLDADSLTGPPAVGCYICETQYEPQLRLRKCPGGPR